MDTKRELKTALVMAVLAVVFLAAGRACCRTIVVRADGTGEYPTIQAAIDDANDGDEVVLEPGTYTGNGNRDIDFLGKAITVRGTDPCDPNVVDRTVIDCNGTKSEKHRGFRFHRGEAANSIVAGLTIINGYAPVETVPWGSCSGGGAIFCSASDPTISKCVLAENTAGYGGGGIFCTNGSGPLISGCLMRNNDGTYRGGGIGCYIASGVTITNCKIVNCKGSGVYLSVTDDVPVKISNCEIRGNWANHFGGGIHIFGPRDGNISLRNCLITDNRAPYEGGGIFLNQAPAVFTNCTFSGNRALRDGGGAIYIASNARPIITNCILWDDTPDEILCSYGLALVYFSDVEEGYFGEGNMDLDPLFVDPGYWDGNGVWVEGDYHLLVCSPCIDAGDPNYVEEPNETDLDGNPRIFGNRVDMGVYEAMVINVPPVSCIVGGDRVVEVGDDCQAKVTLDGSCSSDADSTAGTNDDINDFEWYAVIDVCDANGDIFLGTGEVIECNLGLGEHVIMLEVTDRACAFDTNEVTITVEERTVPVITLNGADTVVLECGVDSYVEEGATATDNCDENAVVVVGGDVVDTSACGTYMVTYDATDDSGNDAEQVLRTVIVQDATPPEFSLVVEPNVLWPPNGKMVLVRPEWEVSDNCDEEVGMSLVDISMNVEGDINEYVHIGDDGSIYLRARRGKGKVIRVYTLIYEAVDDFGNVTEESTTVTVRHKKGRRKLGGGLVRRLRKQIYRRGLQRR